MRMLQAFVMVLTVGLSSPLFAATSPVDFRFRIASDPATLDWTLARSSSETYVILNLMEGLVRHSAELKPEPALASSWTVSPDGKIYRFELRENVKWSDGRKLRAQDFVDSWIRLLDPKTRSDYASFLSEIEGAEAFSRGKAAASAVAARAITESSLEVKLRAPSSRFLHLLTFWVTFPIRSDLIQKHGKAWTSPANLAVVGPYRLAEWKKGSQLTLERNPSYWAPAAGPSRAEIRIEPDEKRARVDFAAGKEDVLLNATTEDLLRQASQGTSAQPGARVAQFPYLATYYLGFNARKGPLKEAGVRKAIAYAIARSEIPSVLQGGQSAAAGFVPPGIDGASSAPFLSGTLYAARGALSKAGFPEGTKLPKLELLIMSADGGEPLARLLQSQLRQKLGIEVEPRVIESATQFQTQLRAGKFDVFVSRWGADYPDALNFLEVFESRNKLNVTGWSSREFDGLIAQSRASADASAKRTLDQRAEKLLLDEHAVIVPLYHRKNTVLVGPRVRELSITPLNYFFLRNVRF